MLALVRVTVRSSQPPALLCLGCSQALAQGTGTPASAHAGLKWMQRGSTMLSAIAVLSDLLQFTSPISRLAVSALLFTQTRWLHTPGRARLARHGSGSAWHVRASVLLLLVVHGTADAGIAHRRSTTQTSSLAKNSIVPLSTLIFVTRGTKTAVRCSASSSLIPTRQCKARRVGVGPAARHFLASAGLCLVSAPKFPNMCTLEYRTFPTGYPKHPENMYPTVPRVSGTCLSLGAVVGFTCAGLSCAPAHACGLLWKGVFEQVGRQLQRPLQDEETLAGTAASRRGDGGQQECGERKYDRGRVPHAA
eukprot:2515632-Rhodomonas_salina.1